MLLIICLQLSVTYSEEMAYWQLRYISAIGFANWYRHKIWRLRLYFVFDIYKFTTCLDIRNYRAWTPECFETREKAFAIIKIAYTTFTNLEKFTNATSGIWTGIKAYGVETGGFDNQARYNHGKIIFNVASLFIGVGEAKAILKGEKTLITVLKESVAA